MKLQDSRTVEIYLTLKLSETEFSCNFTGAPELQSRQTDQQNRSHKVILIFRFSIFILISLIAALVMALEGFVYYLPIHPSNQPLAPWILLIGPGMFLFLSVLKKQKRIDPDLAESAERYLDFMNRLKSKVLEGSFYFYGLFFSVTFITTCLWIPQYLVQPLWTDHEHVIIMARLWDKGYFPWTAMRTYQFPGEMQFAWLAAQIGGWGNPVAFYALDLALLFATGMILAFWSGRLFGTWKYAIFAFAGLLAIEISLPFTGTAQRDTHATLITIIAFCLPALSERIKTMTILNAIFFGFALALRPHTILFLPMLFCGFLIAFHLKINNQSGNNNFKYYFGILGIWTISVKLASLLFFSPVIGPVRTREFFSAMQFPLNQTGDYSQPPFAHWLQTYHDAYRVPRHFWFMVMSGVMILSPGNRKWRYYGFLLGFIFITGAIYRAIHPVDHGYLQLPLQFLECIGLIVIPAWLASQQLRMNGLIWFAFCGLTAHIATSSTVLYFEPGYFKPAMKRLINQTEPDYSPPGARAAYPLEDNIYHYNWSDWVQAKSWLALETKPDSHIMNLLTYQPFPPFCATNDRLPIGRLESIVLLNWFRNYDFQPEIIESLKTAPSGSLVIWEAGRMNSHNIIQLDKVSEFMSRRFQKRIDFGEIEVWEKLDIDE